MGVFTTFGKFVKIFELELIVMKHYSVVQLPPIKKKINKRHYNQDLRQFNSDIF